MRVIKNNNMNINEIVKFSHYYVAGFLRIESLHSFLNRKREYEKYTIIPTLLVEYLQLKTEEEKISFIDAEFSILNKNLYEDSWNKIIEVKINNKKIDSSQYENSDSYIDNLNSLLTKEYKVIEDKFFSSISIIYKEKSPTVEESDFLNLIGELKKLFSNFTKVNEALDKEIDKDKNLARITDLKICTIIISTEFSSFLHHLYVAYHTQKDKEDNIRKSLNHLKRANLDARKAIDLHTSDIYSHTSIMKRLKEINEVGM